MAEDTCVILMASSQSISVLKFKAIIWSGCEEAAAESAPSNNKIKHTWPAVENYCGFVP